MDCFTSVSGYNFGFVVGDDFIAADINKMKVAKTYPVTGGEDTRMWNTRFKQ